MPANYAHHRFGKQILKAFPPEQRQCVQRFRRLFDVGLHGPDIFFHYNPYWKTAVGAMGNQVHAMTGAAFFPAACKAATTEASRAYLYGLLAHYCLDSVCHPFVNQLNAIGEAAHIPLETQFDRVLLVMDGEAYPETFDMSRKLRLTRGECMTVAGFYPGITGSALRRSVRSMASHIRFLAKPQWKKPMKMLGLSFAEHMIPAEEKEEWLVYTEELKLLYEKAVEKYPRMLQELLAHMETGADLGVDFEPDFG